MVAGIDQSASLIENAKELCRTENLEIDFRVADALALPFDQGMFHRVSCQYAIYHFPDMDLALTEMIRVARKGTAKIVITGPSKTNNEEMYAFHLQAGGEIRERAGRTIYEDGVNYYLERHNLKFRQTQYENLVMFPSIGNFLDYYQKTKLFLDNIQEAERRVFLDRMRGIIGDHPASRVQLTKMIGLFEIWL